MTVNLLLIQTIINYIMSDNCKKYNFDDILQETITEKDYCTSKLQTYCKLLNYLKGLGTNPRSEAEIQRLTHDFETDITLEELYNKIRIRENMIQKLSAEYDMIQKDKQTYQMYPHSSFCEKKYWVRTGSVTDICTNCNDCHYMENGNGTKSILISCGECCKEVYGPGGVNRQPDQKRLPIIETRLYYRYLYELK